MDRPGHHRFLTMSHSFHSAARSLHFKVLATAVLSLAVFGVCVFLRGDDSIKAVTIKAGGAVSLTANEQLVR
jgi:hypothetical protein